MKQIIRSSFIILLLMTFLIGTTGVSFYIHECRSSSTREVFAFPEIIKYHSSCSCEDEMQTSASSENATLSLSDPGCCKNTHLYLKASFTSIPVFSGIKKFLVEKLVFSELLTFFITPIESLQVLFIPVQDHSPPPLFGRILLQTIHQIKIPVPFS